MSARNVTYSNTLRALIICLITTGWLGAYAKGKGSQGTKPRDIQFIVNSFDARRMQAIEEIMRAEIPEDRCEKFLSDQIKALAILYHAERTKDYSRVKQANELLLDFCRRLDEPESEWWRRTNHGGAMIALRILLTYQGREELLFPETVAKIRDGKEPDGRILPQESLRSYIPITCYDETRHIGIHTWKRPFEGAWEYTENHRLQMMVHALLLCQIYGEETYDPPDGPPVPLRNDTPEIDDYWGYWKKAFYDYLIGYKKPRYPIEPWQFEEFRHLDWGITEKDGATYTHVFLGDFWLLRDLVDDPVIAKYSEMFIDLILADYVEEAIHGVFVGAHENSEKHSLRLPGLIHIYNHLLFDDLPYVPKAQDYFEWGAWGYMALLTSEYNPTHPDFPRVLIDIAVNKPREGYLVTEGIAETSAGLPGKPKATWIKPDYSLGFGINSWVGWGYHGGGAYVATQGSALEEVGLAILPFGMDDNNHFDLKYSLICPLQSLVAPGVAITQCGTEQLPSKIWIKDGFEEDFTSHPPWMFFAAKSIWNRRVYLAIRPVLSGYQEDTPRKPGTVVRLPGNNVPEWAKSTVPQGALGKIIKFDYPCDYLVWEMSDAERHASFEAFKKAMVANELKISDDCIYYTSCEGIQLAFHRQDFQQHRINGKAINYEDYRYVIKNPWMEWPQNKKQARFQRGTWSAYYNFDPDGDGVLVDQMPEKIVRQELSR
ncbi:MAG: hypothetical protein ONB05_08140 [candidate division KSB1 bacterium]|nr:hypothetical protein [candidate division KSB1 bacterium]